MGLWDIIVESAQEAWEEVNHPKVSRGAVLRVELTRLGIIGFDHYGIYAGNREVIHFSQGSIRKDSLRKFIDGASFFCGDHVDVMAFSSEYTCKISLEESYERACACLGMTGYDVIDSNCEHFAIWCRTGIAISSQAFGKKSNLFELSQSNLFSIPNANFAESINIPRFIGYIFNELGMEKSRNVWIDGIEDF